MSYSVQITQQANSDLRGIFEYIACELQSLQNATGQLSRLEKSINSLDQMPERFPCYDKEPWYSRGLRLMPVDNFCVFYIPFHQQGIVSIVRIIYCSRDIDTQLTEHTKD